jgi:uncharacterized protein with LGFP repeats
MNIKLKDLLNEKPSPAAQQAKAKGLKSKGFGNWADSSGKVTHQTKGGQLVPTKEPKEPKVKAKKKKDKKVKSKKVGVKPPSDDVKKKVKKDKPKKTKSKPELTAKERERRAIKQAEKKKKGMKSGGGWKIGGKDVGDSWDDMVDSADGLSKSWWEDLMKDFTQGMEDSTKI